MDFNMNSFFSNDNDNYSRINSFLSEFNDINTFSYLEDHKDIFEPNEEENIFSNTYDKNKPNPHIFNQEINKTNIISNSSANLSEEKDENTIINDQEYKINVESIQIKIRDDLYSKMPFEVKKKRGRRNKPSEGLGKHSKFADDNLIRKIKNIFLDRMLKFINKKISTLYANDNSKKLKPKLLYKLSQKQVEKSKTEYNKILLNRSLQSIFSEDISTKYKKLDPKHNKKLIEELLNEPDGKKRLIFQKIFNLSFLDVLKHFRGSIFIKELSGMTTFKDYLNKTDFGKNSEDYREILTIFMYNYEKIVMEKHSRIIKKKLNN